MTAKILLVDDEKIKLVALQDVLVKEGYSVNACEDGNQALSRINQERFDIVVTDLRLPGADGMCILKEVKKTDSDTAVIIMTAYGTIENAVEATKMGAYDYITKPFSTDELILKIRKLVDYQRLARENILLRDELDSMYGLDNIVGRTKVMKNVFEWIKTVAATDSTVLIYGESGTGKELVAHSIHHNSPRKDRTFTKVSCAVLAETLLESELFGHEKGAFTGAVRTKIGRFELADGGTLFLDDIDDLSPSVQVKLLRVLQEREFEKVGGTSTIHVDVRIVAASKRDLRDVIKEGKFREDLYYRLNVVAISLPPLRERKEDIPLLIDCFIAKYSRRVNKKIRGISPEVLEILIDYDWPGNVRELENAIESAMVMTPNDMVTPEFLPQSIIRGFRTIAPDSKRWAGFEKRVEKLSSLITANGTKLPLMSEITKEAERIYIREVLEETKWKKGKAAKILGISRKTLWEKIKSLGIKNGDTSHF
jgi:DNA-binding NtrC family response regulator